MRSTNWTSDRSMKRMNEQLKRESASCHSMVRVINSLHVIYCAQLGIDKYVHVVDEVVEQLPPLSVERVSILFPSLLDLGSRRSSILCVVV